MLLQSQRPSLRPQATAHLAQTMYLLALTGGELRQKLDAELATNPALELAEETRCPHCRRPLQNGSPCPLCSSPKISTSDDPIVFVSPSSDFTFPRDRVTSENNFNEDWSASPIDLATFVMGQVVPDLPAKDHHIAAHILTSLDDNGLLNVPLVEIARYHHTTIAHVGEVVKVIQRADPIGVGSPSPQEALIVQLEVLAETREVPPLAILAIQEGMDSLSRRAFGDLAKQLNTSIDEVRHIAKFIGENLNPFPAQAHWGSPHQKDVLTNTYQRPDIIITHLDHSPEAPLVVEIISPYSGSLRVNPAFRKALSQASPEKLEQWRGDLESATLLVKCLQQRNNTLVRLMQKLVRLQSSFILEGDAHLHPITRAKLAEDLDVHESTISRAVAGKALQMPNKRIIPLSKMFDRSLPIRTAIKQIIAEEDKPLSDQEITLMLHELGYPVARRTVAKYRSMEGILPARMRNGHMKEQDR